MQHIIDKTPRMSQPSKAKGVTGATGPTGREGTGDRKVINDKANTISEYKDKFMYDDKGNKYPVSTTTTTKGNKVYPGKLYKVDPKARVR